MTMIDDTLAAIDADSGPAVERLIDFLKIPSVSAVPAHFPDCDRAADWLVADLRAIGFEVAKHPTEGRPMVVGHIKAARRESPHVLFTAITTSSRPTRSTSGARRRSSRRSSPARAASGCRPRRLGRQGPVDDLRRGLPRLPEVRRPALRGHGAHRGRRGDRLAVAARLPRQERQDAQGRHRPRLRHRDVGPDDAGDHHRAARHRRRRGDPDGRQPRPALGRLRRRRRESDPRSRRASSAACTTPTAPSRCRASTTASRSFPRRSWSSGRGSISTPAPFSATSA